MAASRPSFSVRPSAAARSIAVGGLALAAALAGAQSDPYAAPASYYAGVSGTGATLQNTLAAAMSAGHIQRSYGVFRQSAAIHDADPVTSGNILLVYNTASVSGTWNSGVTWNREHVWPQSRQPGSASNSSTGNLGDPHALRPCNPSINSARGNRPFGFASTTGSHGTVGSFYFPGDLDKGDIARSLFYSATRYASTGLDLVNGSPGSNQMGGLEDLVAWHYIDVPDEFERRRNHAIYSSSLNPSYFTNNRNAFVDLPGTVWSVFVDQANDSRLYVGDAPLADGSSVLEIDFGSSIVGTPVPPQPFMVRREGLDGTYFAVTPAAGTFTDAPLTNGFTDAFPIGPASGHEFLIALPAPELFSAGSKVAELTIDNLDRTLSGGAGRGGNDADDVVRLLLDVFNAGTPSFDGSSVQASASVDLGAVSAGSRVELPVSLHTLAAAGPTAGLLFEVSGVTGDSSALDLDLDPSLVEVAAPLELFVDIDGSGSVSATYTISAGDDPGVLGAAARGTLTLQIDALIQATCTGDLADSSGFGPPDGQVDFGDFFALSFLAGPCGGGTPNPDCVGDFADGGGFGPPDGTIDFGDFFALSFLAGPCQ